MLPALYAILEAGSLPDGNLTLATRLARAGVELIQLRDKHASSRKIYDTSLRWSRELLQLGVRMILNDRPDIAAMTHAGGVHVGQEDVPVEIARNLVGEERWVGVSTHNLEQLREAALTSADYIAVGPIFPTTTKENPDPVVGLELIRAARRLTKKPLVAIGGITIESAEAVFRAGADSVAVARDLLTAGDPSKRAREYLDAAKVRAQGN
ncbi:MAG TPA: thiamine phosphate synthase [Candidatus Sulfotelmatobacter sp.]|nr:thiamine phosphate synthase [Candidatus Sulfotelmatobacter sp.]